MDVTVLAQNILYGLMNGAGYVLFASGLALTFGVMRVMNFAHGEVYMLGAMLVFTLTRYFGVNLFAAVVIAIAVVAAFGYVINRFAIQTVFRISILAPMLSTLGMSLIMLRGGEAIWTAHARVIESPFTGIIRVAGLAISQMGLAVIIIGLVVGVGLHIFMAKVPVGKEMRATVSNLIGANLVGINTGRIYAVTLVVACGLAALGGILLGLLHTSYPAMGQPVLITGFVIVIVAGLGNVLGAAIVAVGIGVLESLFVFYTAEQYTQIFIYLIMIAVLLTRPQGLFGARGG